jgi:hypothetical protein
MQRLNAEHWPPGVEIQEMNWGPVAIVQDLQARSEPPERVVLVGALDRGLPTGSVTRRHWQGGKLDPAAVQRRMFEAVTGVISLDNLLVIGAQFGVWPAQTFTVELQWPESGIGDLVLEELDQLRGTGRVVGEQPLSAANEQLVQCLVQSVRELTLDEAPRGVQSLSSEQLTPVSAVLHSRFVDRPGPNSTH